MNVPFPTGPRITMPIDIQASPPVIYQGGTDPNAVRLAAAAEMALVAVALVAVCFVATLTLHKPTE